MVAKLDGTRSHETVERAIVALENLEHRGAAGADPNTGDGAGILLQLPDEFIRGVIEEDLPPPGAYGVCVCFLPREEERRDELEQLLERTVADEGQRVVAWRDVPVDKDYVGITANLYAPYVKQLVVAPRGELRDDQDAFERKLYVIRRVAEIAAGPELVIPSFSQPHDRLQGHAHQPAAAGLLPRPRRPAHEVRARAGPLALLDQHLPELGARAPVPDDRPQRRDQHAARQRELDAGARVAARLRALRRRPAEGAAGRAPRRQRLARRSTTSSSCSCWRAAASRTRS